MADPAVGMAFANWQARFVVRGVDYGDVVRLSRSILRWRDWLPLWCEVAEEHVELARDWEAAGHGRSAGEAWNRAALCFHFGCFLTTHDEAGYLATSGRAVDARRRSLALLDPSAERREVELPPSRMVAILRRPGRVRRPPLVIILPGLDSTKEEFQTWEEVFLTRGMATLSLDGPGQGEGGYGGAPMRADYEAAVGALLNSLEGRDDLDLARVGLIGVSLGGYYAARAAAYEPRVRAVVSVGGPFDVGECWKGLPSLTREKAEFHLRGGDPAAFTLREAARHIRQHLLVVFGRQDRLFPPGQAERLAREAPRAQLVMYDAGNHACTNLFSRHAPMEADWLKSRLG